MYPQLLPRVTEYQKTFMEKTHQRREELSLREQMIFFLLSIFYFFDILITCDLFYL